MDYCTLQFYTCYLEVWSINVIGHREHPYLWSDQSMHAFLPSMGLCVGREFVRGWGHCSIKMWFRIKHCEGGGVSCHHQESHTMQHLAESKANSSLIADAYAEIMTTLSKRNNNYGGSPVYACLCNFKLIVGQMNIVCNI